MTHKRYMHLSSYTLLFFLLLSVLSYCSLYADDIVSYEVIIKPDQVNAFEVLTPSFFDHFTTVQKITYESDIAIAPDEFYHLVDIPCPPYDCKIALKKALLHLMKKNKLSEIRLRIIEKKGIPHLHFILTGLWTVSNIKIHGILTGKESFRQHYLIEPGEQFNLKKHELSVDKIREACKHDGYFNSNIKSSFSYDYTTKSIIIHLTIHKGTRFSVDPIIVLNIESEQNESNAHIISQLKYDIHKKFLNRLCASSYNKNNINQQTSAIKKFLIQKGYLNVIIELEESIDVNTKKIMLTFNIRLHQKRLFTFLGNKTISNNELIETFLLFGRSTWLLPASLLAEEIIRLYHEKGFWHVNVDTKEEQDNYFFLIQEGNRIQIDSIEIQNAFYCSPCKLIKRFFKDIKKNNFSENILKESCNNLIEWYGKEGFLQAHIITQEYKPTHIPHVYTLVINLHEGPQHILDTIYIPSFPDLITNDFFTSILHKQPVPFTTTLVQTQRNWLLMHFKSLGYMQATVKPETIYDEHAHIKLIWHIDLGPGPLRFGKTIIADNPLLPSMHIMRALCYQPGEFFNYEKIRQSFLQLKDLEIFESIQLHPIPLYTHSEEQPMLVRVKLDDPIELRIRSGFELQHIQNYKTFGGVTYKVGGTVLIKNPTNTADQFRFDADITGAHREIIAQYKRPWLHNFPMKTLIEAHSIKHDQPGFIGNSKNIYTITQQGFLVGLNKKWEHTNYGITMGIEWMETKIHEKNALFAARLARAINFKQTLLDEMIPFFFIEPTIIINYLDNSLDPHYGLFTLLSLKGMIPMARHHINSYFIKVLLEQSCFMPFGPFVGALHVRLGHIFHQEFDAIMPIERFYLGGSHSLRSYEPDLAPPVGVFTDDNGCQQIVPRGGKTMVNINLELRMPFFKHVTGVIFQDLGLLSSDMQTDLRPQNILTGLGFGLRYNTPIGPLRFDIGWKLHPLLPHESHYAWFLTFGHAF